MFFALLVACAPELTPDTFAEDGAEIICSGLTEECVGGGQYMAYTPEECREAYAADLLAHYDCEAFDARWADACLDELALQMSCENMTEGVDFQPAVSCEHICAEESSG